MEDGDDVFFAYRDGMRAGIVEVGRRCLFDFSRRIVV